MLNPSDEHFQYVVAENKMRMGSNYVVLFFNFVRRFYVCVPVCGGGGGGLIVDDCCRAWSHLKKQST